MHGPIRIRLFIVDSTRFFKQVIWCLNLIMPITTLNKLWSHDEQFKAYLSVYVLDYDDDVYLRVLKQHPV